MMIAEDKLCGKRKTINCRGKLLALDKPVVMGILNITPDSFYAGSRFDDDSVPARAAQMLRDGAAILDVGGQSTRPGSDVVSAGEEAARVVPVIERLHKQFPEAVISVDTYWADVARQSLEAGAHIVNDVSGGEEDEEIMSVAAKYGAPYVLMHKKGTFKNMQNEPEYENVLHEVLDYLRQRIAVAEARGVKDVLVDPGFGFGKNLRHNYRLLAHLREFCIFERPVMVGMSRKRMINSVLGTAPAEALNGTTAVNTMALLNGANVLRVHDVKAATEAVKLFNTYNEAV